MATKEEFDLLETEFDDEGKPVLFDDEGKPCLVDDQGRPHLLVLIGDDENTQHEGGQCLGLYKLLPEGVEGCDSVVYRQRHDGEDPLHLFRHIDYWYIGCKPDEGTGFARREVEDPDETMPDPKGWEVWSRTLKRPSAQQSDLNSKKRETECQWVPAPTWDYSFDVPLAYKVIKVTFEDSKLQDEYGGNYWIVKGEYNLGRPVLKISSGKDLYLIAGEQGGWSTKYDDQPKWLERTMKCSWALRNVKSLAPPTVQFPAIKDYEVPTDVTCKRGHSLSSGEGTNWSCDLCRGKFKDEKTWRCALDFRKTGRELAACNFDCCNDCVYKAKFEQLRAVVTSTGLCPSEADWSELGATVTRTK